MTTISFRRPLPKDGPTRRDSSDGSGPFDSTAAGSAATDHKPATGAGHSRVNHRTDTGDPRWSRLGLALGATTLAFFPTVSWMLTPTSGAQPGLGISAVLLVITGVTVGVLNPRPPRVSIHDREVDVVVGLCLITAAAIITSPLVDVGDLSRLLRPDLVALALFLPGMLTISLGLRQMMRCWPAVIGLVLVNPVVLAALHDPLARANMHLGVLAATSASEGAVVTTPEMAPILSFAADGVMQWLSLETALVAYLLLPTVLATLIVVSIVQDGSRVIRRVMILMGLAAVIALLTLRIWLGVLIATTVDVSLGRAMLSTPATAVTVAIAVLVVIMLSPHAGLRTKRDLRKPPPPTWATNRVPLTTAAGLSLVAVVGLSLLGSWSALPLSNPPRTDAQATVATSLPDGFTVVSRSTNPSPLRSNLGIQGLWTRTTYQPTVATDATAQDPARLVLDQVDANAVAEGQLVPSNLLYDEPASTQLRSTIVEIAPGIEARLTPAIDGTGRLALLALTWTENVRQGDGTVVSLIATFGNDREVPAPSINVAAVTIGSFGSLFRRNDVDPTPTVQMQITTTGEQLMASARALLALPVEVQ